MLRMFVHLNQLYEMEKILLIDAILTYHLRKESDEDNSSEPSAPRKYSAKENTSKPSPSRKESVEENSSKTSPSRKEGAKENTSKPSTSRKDSAKENISRTSPTKVCCGYKTKRTSQANSDSYKTDLNAKKVACNEERSSEE